MKKYVGLITISLALIVITILAGMAFKPNISLDANSQKPTRQMEDGQLLISTLSNAPHTPATFFTFGEPNSPVVFLNLPVSQVDINMEVTLVSAAMAGNQPGVCTHAAESMVNPPVGFYNTLPEQYHAGSYWQQVKAWLAPAEYRVVLWQTNNTLNDYLLVSGDAEHWSGNCPTPVGKDV